MTIHLDMCQELMDELKELIDPLNGEAIDINSTEVKSTVFYQKMQDTTEFDARRLIHLVPEELLFNVTLLIAEIAGKSSPMLVNINMSANEELKEQFPEIAKSIALSSSIKKVEIAACHLGKYGPATAAAFATSPSIETVDMSFSSSEVSISRTGTTYGRDEATYSSTGEYGPATAAAFVKSSSIKKVIMNELNEYKPMTSAVFTEHNKYIADLKENILNTNHIPIDSSDLKGLVGEYSITPIIEFELN